MGRLRIRIRPPGAPERTVEIDAAGTVRLGRLGDLEVPLPIPSVSALHARLVREEAGWVLEDAGSSNGCFVEGERLARGERRRLPASGAFRLAEVDLRAEAIDSPAAMPAVGGVGAVEGTATIARRLVADLFQVRAGDHVARLVVENGPLAARALRLAEAGRSYVVGRGDRCDLALPDEDVSREHVRLVRDYRGVLAADLASKNGLLMGGERVTGERRLRDGDVLTVGTTRLRLEDPEDRYLREIERAADAPPPAARHDPPAPSSGSAVPAPAPRAASRPMVASPRELGVPRDPALNLPGSIRPGRLGVPGIGVALGAIALVGVAAVAIWLVFGG